MENLRESFRVDAQHFISYDIYDEDGKVILSGMALSRDLSRKGVQMEDRVAFPLNARIRLHLAVGDEVVDVEGNVRHVEKIDEDKYHIGIEFVEIREEVIRKIGKFYPEILKD